MTARFAPAILICCLIVLNVHAQTPAQPKTDSLGDPLPDGAIARLGTLRFQHTPASGRVIENAVLSPDGTKVVSLTTNSSVGIRLWEAESGKEIAGPWSAASQRFSAVCFSPDSKILAAAVVPSASKVAITAKKATKMNPKTLAGTTFLFDIAAGKQVATLPPGTKMVRALAFADGGKTLVTAGAGVVRWLDIAAAKEIKTWQPFAGEKPKSDAEGKQIKTFTYCDLSPDGKHLAVQMEWAIEGQRQVFRSYAPDDKVDKEAIGFDLDDGKKTWQIVSKEMRTQVGHFAFSKDGKRVAIALGPDKVEVRDAHNGKLVRWPLQSKLGTNARVGGLALSSDGTIVALADGSSNVVVWNLKETSAARKFAARVAQNRVNSTQFLHFSADDKKLLLGVDAGLQLYHVDTLQEVHAWEGHRGWVDFLAFTADGKRLLTGSAASNFNYTELAAWDTASWKRLQLTSQRTPAWSNMGFASPEQSVYVGKSGDEQFKLFNLQTGQPLAKMLVPNKSRAIDFSAFSPQGKHFVLSALNEKNQSIERVYAVPSGKLLCELPIITLRQDIFGFPQALRFSPNEKLLARYGRGDGLIYVHDTATGKLRHALGTKMDFDEEDFFDSLYDLTSIDVAFSNDGKLMASWWLAEKNIRIWDMETGKEIAQFQPDDPGAATQRIIHLAWSPDKRILAVGQNKVRLWETATLKVRRELTGHAGASIHALAFAPDGRVLATSAADTTVLLWDMMLSDHAAPPNLAMEKAWEALASDDAPKAFAAILDLTATPLQTIAWIKDRLKPSARIDRKLVESLIEDLNDNQFKTRQGAAARLLKIGERALPAIDNALASKPALETKLRLDDIRKRLTGLVLSGERIQAFRAVEVLERLGTRDARAVLQALAGGEIGALTTVQAQHALERLRLYP